MDTPLNITTGTFFGINKLLIFFFREFIFLVKKIIIIVIISTVEVGNPPISYQNNAFFIGIINSLLFAIELKLKPFGIPQLNSLNFISNFITIITIFGGLFSSINQQTVLSLILMIIIISMNIYFMLIFLKYFIQIRLSFINKNNVLTKWLKKFYYKFWPSG